MKGFGEMLTLRELEKLDRVVEILGLDFNRAIYFKNSRSLLSEANQKDAFQVIEKKGTSLS